MMNEVLVDGLGFRVGVMPPREQFHVMRRLTPILGPALPALMALLDEEADKEAVLAQVAGQLGPLSESLAGMPDEQLDYVMDRCLTQVQKLDSDGKYHPIYLKQQRGIVRMYETITLPLELKLVSEVIKANLSGFFELLSGASASSLSAPSAPASQPRESNI